MKLNQRQHDHLARGLQAIAIGQLAYYGYRMFTEGRLGWFIGSLIVYVAIETYAVFLLKGPRMNGYIVLLGLFALATVIAAPIIISDWRREARKKTKRP
jgi:hypothetical protein